MSLSVFVFAIAAYPGEKSKNPTILIYSKIVPFQHSTWCYFHIAKRQCLPCKFRIHPQFAFSNAQKWRCRSEITMHWIADAMCRLPRLKFAFTRKVVIRALHCELSLSLSLSLYPQCLLPAYKLYSQIKEIISNVKSENEQLVETIEALEIWWLVSRGCAIEIIFVVIGHSLLSNEMKCFCAVMSVHSITSNNINIWDRRTSENRHFANSSLSFDSDILCATDADTAYNEHLITIQQKRMFGFIVWTML